MIAPGWMSVAVYDPKVDAVVTVAEATETTDDMLDAVDGETKRIRITEFSVKGKAYRVIMNALKNRRREVQFP